MNPRFLIRQGYKSDYIGFREAEQRAWRGTGVPVINRKIYNSWLEIFPAGLLVAEMEGKISAHHYAQKIIFDWQDLTNHRSWVSMTDNGSSRNTHKDEGNVLYGVSLSSCARGAGRAVFTQALMQVKQFNLEGYVGACRIPGLVSYANLHKKYPSEIVEEYVARVMLDEIRDATLSSLLSVPGVVVQKLLPDYFQDSQSANWACLITYKVR